MHLVGVRRKQRALVAHLRQPADQARRWWRAVCVGMGCAQGLQSQQDGGVRFVAGDACSLRAQLSRQCDSRLRLATPVQLERDAGGDQGQHQESDEPGYGEPQPPVGAAQPHFLSYGERVARSQKGPFLRAEVSGELRPGTQAQPTCGRAEGRSRPAGALSSRASPARPQTASECWSGMPRSHR